MFATLTQAGVEFKGNIPKEVVNACAGCFQLSDSMELNCSTGEWENNLPSIMYLTL